MTYQLLKQRRDNIIIKASKRLSKEYLKQNESTKLSLRLLSFKFNDNFRIAGYNENGVMSYISNILLGLSKIPKDGTFMNFGERSRDDMDIIYKGTFTLIREYSRFLKGVRKI